MSKKKSLMDGYFDQFKNDVADINPHVAEMVRVAKEGKSGIEPVITQPERRDKAIQNEAKSEPERSQQPGQNVAIEIGSSDGDPTLLVGTQRQVFKYFFELTQKFASLKTPRLTLESMSAATGLRETQVHSATKHLRQKGCVIISSRKDGRGGWVEYSVTQLSFDLWTRLENTHKRSHNVELTELKRSQQPGHKAIQEPSCSSNININNTTTTHPELEPDLWLSVPKNIEGRVSLKQLRDFLKQGLISADDLQNSLDGFAYDLEKGSVRAKNGNPVAILIGAVKSGGYISQSYLSELKASLADVAKARDEMQQIQAANLTNQLQEEFESFRGKFPDQAAKMKPMSKYLTNFELGSVGYKMWLEEYRKTLRTEQNIQASEAQA